jgi:lysylphosphatidylglycerol synthetase-like protein (DUF2156 family)
LNRLTKQFTPRLLATFSFAAGVVLLASGTTPAASHFAGSIVGATLLLLSQGLARPAWRCCCFVARVIGYAPHEYEADRCGTERNPS